MTWVVQTATLGPGVWNSLGGAVESNPTIALLGFLLAAFLAGFAVRKFFEDREVTKLRHRVEEHEAALAVAQDAGAAAAEAAESRKQLAERLRGFLSPEELRGPLAKHLNEFPAEVHGELLASLMRQLVLTPGWAWICTPSATVRVHADFDPALGASHIRAETHIANDPIAELREAIKSSTQLATAMLHLSLYGISRVGIRVDADHQKLITAMQGPGSDWSLDVQTLRRIDPPPT